MALLESLTDLPCCGDPILCGSKVCKTELNAPDRATAPAPYEVPAVETVPCNEAWAALKQHPNIGFAGELACDYGRRSPLQVLT